VIGQTGKKHYSYYTSERFYTYIRGDIKMISKRQLLPILFFCSTISLSFTTVQPYYQRYFSNHEVFQIIRTNNRFQFDEWMRLYPQVNIYNEYGQTPLMIAAQLQHNYFIQRLLDAGAYRSSVDNFGKTARDYALQAEGYYVSPSSNSSDALTAVGVGAAFGLCAYVAYELCKEIDDSTVTVSYNYNGRSYNTYEYCTKCNYCFDYTTDPQKLYCNSCYRSYCKQQSAYQARSSRCNSSDLL